MAEQSEINRGGADRRVSDMAMTKSALDAWFAREVLPLEAVLMQFLSRNWRNAGDLIDLRQDVYVRVYEAANKSLPDNPRSFLFSTAHNMLVDHVRRNKIVPIEFASQLDAFGAPIDEPGPDRNAIARDDLRRLQQALDDLPPRTRSVVILRRVDGLSRNDIAKQLGISAVTIKWHLNEGLRALADAVYGVQPESKGRQ